MYVVISLCGSSFVISLVRSFVMSFFRDFCFRYFAVSLVRSCVPYVVRSLFRVRFMYLDRYVFHEFFRSLVVSLIR